MVMVSTKGEPSNYEKGLNFSSAASTMKHLPQTAKLFQ